VRRTADSDERKNMMNMNPNTRFNMPENEKPKKDHTDAFGSPCSEDVYASAMANALLPRRGSLL